MSGDSDKAETPQPSQPAGEQTRIVARPDVADDETRIIARPDVADDETRVIPRAAEKEPADAPPDAAGGEEPAAAPPDAVPDDARRAEPAAPEPELRAGSTFAGFLLLEEIARGEMGVVYRAKRLSLDRTEAIKLIAPRYAADADFRARFRREAMNAAITRHPHIIDVYDADEREGHLFIAMQFVDGIDLRRRLQSGLSMSAADAVDVVQQVGTALDAAHAGGVIHRDVKPGNILLAGEPGAWHAYLSDFGVSRRLSASSDLTQPGSIVGTPSYTAPEQQLGQPIDRRADVYSLGCVLYELLTGRKPYEGDSAASVAIAHIQAPIPEVGNVAPALAAAFGPVLAKALAKDPDQRFESAGELASAAVAALADSQMPARGPEAEQPTLQQQPRPTPAGSRSIVVVCQLAALAACLAVVALIRLPHNYIDFGSGMESLWDATRPGGDSFSSHTVVDFRNLVILDAAASVLLALSLFVLRRLLACAAMLVGLLVVGQIFRFRLGLGFGTDWPKPDAVGVSYWLSLVAGAVIVAGAAIAAVVPRRTAVQ